ncbi:MAG: sterol desaturase family protein [Candidatus Neomarinimicrobiota bacterium]|jgi:sterol desaturase/sphingolipid hydroxylase (fatty acid hydroxylase superfamily)|nr:sterol desaturase family protein [Candidatus Neomarinimicrobiota bacterium]|tara:strand:- start:1914 stop:3152 length:1239 start_codon:yes stop_codon:yes gene_type:complete
MFSQDSSPLITYAIPFFMLLVGIEFVYGLIKKENNYRINDALASMSLGLISRFVPLLGLGFQYVVYTYVAEEFNLSLLNSTETWVWVTAFFMYDLCYYWMHRLHHEIKVFWATHVVHHHGEEFNLSTAMRQTSTGFLWKWIFFLPMFLVGIPPNVFVTVAGINLIYQFWVHTEHIGKLGVLEYIFITPSNHRIHHAQNDDYLDANYGGVFIIWDRIFGTYIDERDDLKPVYGTVKPLKTFNPLWANIEVFYQMILDSYHTKKWKDKIRVWFSPPAWRPDDVKDRYPVDKNDLNNFEKYDPEITKTEKIFAFFQFTMINGLTILMLFNVDKFSYQEMAGVAILVSTLAISNALLLDGKRYANNIEVVRACAVLVFVYLGFFTNFVYLILGHTIIALIVASIFSLRFNQARTAR